MEDHYTLHVGRNLLVTNDLFLRRAQLEWLVMGVMLWSPDGELLDINGAARWILADYKTSFMSAMTQPPCQKLFQEAARGKTSGWTTLTLAQAGVQISVCFLPLYNFENSLVGVVTYLFPPGLQLDTYPHLKEKTEQCQYPSNAKQRKRDDDVMEACAKDTHEIRNLLTTVRGYLQLFEKNVDDEAKKYLTLAMRELDQAVSMSQDLLKRFRQMNGGAPVSLAELFRELELLIQQKAIDKEVSISFAIDDNDLTVSADKDKLKQVLMNLVQNGIEAIPAAGRVHVWAGRLPERQPEDNGSTNGQNKEYVSIFVCDDGPGIPEEQRDKVFDAFFTTKGSGTGLGLPISRRIMREMNGDLL